MDFNGRNAAELNKLIARRAHEGILRGEYALLGASHRSCTMAVGAGLCATAILGACTITVRAGYVFLQFEFLFYALGYLLEAELYLNAKV